MRWRPVLTTVLVPLIVALMAAWFSAPWWLPVLAEQQLARQGFTLIRLEIDRIGWRESRLERLHVRQIAGSLEADVDGLVASYSLTRLLDGQLDGLTIDRLQLQIHPAPQQHQETALVLVSPAALLTSIPIGHMQISTVIIRRLDNSGHVLQELLGQANLRDQAVSVELKEPVTGNPLQAGLTLDTTGRLQAWLNQGGEQIVRADAQIMESGQRFTVEGEMHAELGALERVARSWIKVPDAYRLQGSFDARWQASLPSDMTLKQSDIETELTATAGIALDAMVMTATHDDSNRLILNTEVEYARGTGKWKVGNDSRLLLGAGK